MERDVSIKLNFQTDIVINIQNKTVTLSHLREHRKYILKFQHVVQERNQVDIVKEK